MALTNAQLVTQLYIGYYGRAPDQAGLNYWVAALNNGATLNSLAANFATAAEAQALYPELAPGSPNSTPFFFVEQVYQNILDRAPDAAGLAFWVNAIQTGAVTPGQFMLTVETSLNTQATSDSLTLANKTKVALDFMQDLTAAGLPYNLAEARTILANVSSDPNSVNVAEAQIQGFISPPTGGALPTIFTNGTDVLTSTDSHTYNATLGGNAPTLTANDSLHGAGNTLAITDVSGANAQDVIPAGVVLTGVPTITLTTTGNAGANGASTFNVSGFASVTNLSVTTSGTGTDFITVGAGVAVSVTQNASATLNVSGALASLAVTSNSLAALNLTGANGTVSLTDPAGPTSLTVTLTSATITGFTDASNHISTLSFVGTGVIGAITDTALTTINLNNGIALGTDSTHLLTLGLLVANVNATSDNSASYVAASGAGTNISLGSGSNTVSLGALAYTGTLAFGVSGTDTVNATVGGNIGGGTITTGGATVNLVVSAAGTETLSTAEYGTFSNITFTGGAFATETLGFSNAGTVTALTGVGNYILSTAGDTITLTMAAQNLTGAASGSDTVNLNGLTYTGTIAFGAAGADTINGSVNSDISGGTITSGGATVSLALNGPGSETLNTAEYNTLNGSGGISFHGTTPSQDTITFSNAGTVTASANVANYNLSTAGDTITLTLVGDNVTGAASGSDVVNLAALAYTGATAFGGTGTDSIDVTVGGDISGGTITSGGATVSLVLSGAGSETMNTAEYNLFNATGISGGTFGGDTIVLSNAGTVTANANVGNYTLSTAGNTITLTNVGDNVTGAASGSDVVNLAALAYTGTTAFGAAGTDSIDVTVGGNISGGTITTGGATVGLVLSAAGSETLNTAEYNLFNANSITGGTFGGDTIVFSNAGTVTSNANVGNYNLSTAGNTITLTNVGDNVTGAASGSDTVNLAALAYTGTLAFGAAGSDSVNVTVGGNISGGTITTGGATVGLVLSAAGSETLNTAEYNLFNANSITGGTFGGDTIVFSNAGTVTSNANVGNYNLSTAGNTITLTSLTANVTGAASGNDIVAIPQFSFTGTLAFGAAGTDIVQDPTNGDFSALTVTSTGATLELMITGVASGVTSGSTTTTEIYNAFTTGPHAGGLVYPGGGDTNPADYIMAFSDQGTVTDSAKVSNYYLNASVHSTIADIYTFTIANNAADNITEFSAATGGSTYNINVAAFTGAISLGSSGTDTVQVAAGNSISGGQITSSGTAVALSVTGSGTVTVSSAEAALFHAAPSPIAASGTDTMNIADATSPINLNAHENALTTVGLQAGANTVNISVGAASVNAGAAGFNQTVSENGTGGNTFNVNNGAATITGASDASHYVTINNFTTASDNLVLTLSGVAQNAGQQNIGDAGNDTITVLNNGVIIETNLGALPGFTVFNATDLASAAANMLRAINASTATTGEYTFVIDSNQGAAIYEIHVNSGGSTIDGIQLVGVIHGVGAFNLLGHVT